ncbi:Rep_fac-A_C domain-containing protein [Raphanus sativus]|nr:Rep_fac-A_C domain-containing protein [Raphanus sativus]KAJ4914929.1 Rep_fac-A_C domain-containing protein [Raphanus sativus]
MEVVCFSTQCLVLIFTWTAEGESCFYKLVARDTGLPSAAPLLRGYAKVEPVTIRELNDFIITAMSQVISYRVEMVVEDDTAEGTFVCFDGEMTNLHNLRASEAGRLLAYTFEVRFTSYNFTAHHQTFTVSCIINEIDHAPAPDFVENVGDDDYDDDDPDGRLSHGSLTSGSGGCEASKSTGKKPVGDAHKTDATTSKVVKKACVA